MQQEFINSHKTLFVVDRAPGKFIKRFEHEIETEILRILNQFHPPYSPDLNP